MNPAVQKYAPPLVVLGAAIYLGWPPSPAIDLGEDVVTAKAVRWKADQLKPSLAPSDIIDPFGEVLVVKEAPVLENQQPVGPTVDEIQAVLSLSGIANMGGRSWALLNGRARQVGDTVKTGDEAIPSCTIVRIERDHVVVRCQERVAVIRPQVSRGATKKMPAAAAPAFDQPPPQSLPTEIGPPTDSVPIVESPEGAPPQA